MLNKIVRERKINDGAQIAAQIDIYEHQVQRYCWYNYKSSLTLFDLVRAYKHTRMHWFLLWKCIFAISLVVSGSERQSPQPSEEEAENTCKIVMDDERKGVETATATTTVPAAESTTNTMSYSNSLYKLRPLTKYFGAEVHGVDLTTINMKNPAFLDQLKRDLIQHRVLLFRNQQNLTGQRQVEISKMLGTVTSTFYKHPESPHPDIFRVSNNEDVGCTNVGRSGWHIDGTFMMRPFSYQTMYFESVVEGGDTYFIPLREFYDSQPEETQQRWKKLWMVTGRRQTPVHPLVCNHPYRSNNETTMLFHCGEPFVKGWFQEDENGQVDTSNLLPSRPVQEELTQALDSKLDELGLRMQWQQGDFMINDNLGLVHYASEGTQADWRTVGLRILHRTTIVGGPDTVPQSLNGKSSFHL